MSESSVFSKESISSLCDSLHLDAIELDSRFALLAFSKTAAYRLALSEDVLGKDFFRLPGAKDAQLGVLKTRLEELKENKTVNVVSFASNALIASRWQIHCLSNGHYLLLGDLGEDSPFLRGQLSQITKLVSDQHHALDVSSIVAITDQRGVIIHVNDTFCRVSGYEREDLLGKTHQLINSGEHDAEFFKDLWSTISKGHVWKGEIVNKRKDGSLYWVDTTIVPFLNEQTRKPYQYVAIRRDITEQMQTLETLNKERARSWHQEKMVSLGEMAAGIAHELGNPIASIQAWLDVMESQLLRGVDDLDKFLRTLPKVREDARRIRDIIRGMLSFARDGSRDPFRSENLGHMLKLVYDYCSYRLKKQQVEWQLELANPYLELECRLTELSQVFVNLVLNACDAMAVSERKLIKIEVIEDDTFVEMRVCDSGPGIDPEVAVRIWDPFFTTKAAGSGTGLGLSITRSIVENHGGRIDLVEVPQGSCFVIHLPKKQISKS